jgi:hypothetical protein
LLKSRRLPEQFVSNMVFSNKYFLEWLLRIPFGRFASTPEPWQPDYQILDYSL